jgi:hypothetical protein
LSLPDLAAIPGIEEILPLREVGDKATALPGVKKSKKTLATGAKGFILRRTLLWRSILGREPGRFPEGTGQHLAGSLCACCHLVRPCRFVFPLLSFGRLL